MNNQPINNNLNNNISNNSTKNETRFLDPIANYFGFNQNNKQGIIQSAVEAIDNEGDDAIDAMDKSSSSYNNNKYFKEIKPVDKGKGVLTSPSLDNLNDKAQES
jgi:hypothetical protein